VETLIEDQNLRHRDDLLARNDLDLPKSFYVPYLSYVV